MTSKKGLTETNPESMVPGIILIFNPCVLYNRKTSNQKLSLTGKYLSFGSKCNRDPLTTDAEVFLAVMADIR